MSRPVNVNKATENKARIRGYISQPLADRMNLILLDPFTQKPRYGSLSQLLEKLIAKWVEEVEQKGSENGLE